MESSEVPTLVPEGEREAYLRNFIGKAIELGKAGRWKDTISHLANKAVAEAVGLEYEDDTRTWMLWKKPSPEEVEELSDAIADNSEFKHPGKGSIKTANVATPPPKATRGIPVEIPDTLWHEVALIHLEEWLHALQQISKKFLIGSQDYEKDVCDYLKQNGVALTNTFLRRNGRKT